MSYYQALRANGASHEEAQRCVTADAMRWLANREIESRQSPELVRLAEQTEEH